MGYSIGKVARIARVTVRTLRHYDEMGLLHPSGRLDSGYRSYSAEDLERLQRILCYRQLGFPLDTVKALLDDPNTDPLEHLRRQRALLNERIDALRQMVATVEKIMEARTMGINLEPDELLEVFGDTDPTEHSEEAEQNWGDTDAWAESQRRVSTYTKEDWLRMRAENAALMADIAAARAEGARPTASGRWTSRRRTGRIWSAGSTIAATRCIAGWATCTSTTPGSRPISPNSPLTSPLPAGRDPRQRRAARAVIAAPSRAVMLQSHSSVARPRISCVWA